MTRKRIAFLLVAASPLVLAAQGADAAFVSTGAAALAARSSLVLQMHGCHRYCAIAPSGKYGYHRHIAMPCGAASSIRSCPVRNWLFWQRWWQRY
jgi:hypothetical protein